jgi:membrane protein
MGLSQQIAYSSLLAFFPAAAFLVGLFSIFHLFHAVETLIGTVAPHGVIRFIDTLRRDSQGGGAKATAFVLGFLGAVWAASGAMGAVIKAVNRAYDRIETRPFWKVRAIAIVLVIVSGLTTAGLFLLIVIGGKLGEAIARRSGALGGGFNVVWDIVRWPLAFCAVLLFFAFVYYLAPNRLERSWKWLTPGSLLGGLLWLALSGLFALYVTFAGHYTKTYGTIATGVILLLWLNYSAFALLFGAELNAELERRGSARGARG